MLAFGELGEEERKKPENKEALRSADLRWRRSLERLCDWAWIAVMRPLSRLAGRRWPGRVPRLVLVPVGRLGAVPWHAARRLPRGGGRPVYACEELVLSYAATGRQRIDVSQGVRLPLRESPLIVGDPTGTLRFAPIEGVELLDRFYPHARYLGLPQERHHGWGVPREVEAHFPSADRPGASMMHFGCHAFAYADSPSDSCLRLAGDQPLRLEALLRAAYGRDPSAPGGTVSLVACTSDFARTHYDEVLTLATAFITLGAVSVVGARWEIPDSTSPLLTVRYHEFLNAGLSPRDALRRAQLWMIDPARPVPEGLDPRLRDLLERPTPGTARPEDLMSWAAFTHQGR